MTRFFLLILTLLLSVHGRAQNDPYEEGNRLFIDSYFDKAYPYFEAAQSLYHKQGDTQGECKALISMGNCLYFQGKMDACLNDYKRALQVTSQKRDVLTEYKILTYMKKVYVEQTDMRNIMVVSNKIDSLLNTSKSSSLSLHQLAEYANMAITNNNIPMAEYYYLKIDEMLNTLPSATKRSNQLDFYSVIKDFYTRTKQYDKAIQFSKKYISCAKDTLPPLDVYISYAQEARIYGFMKQKEMATADLDTARIGMKIDEDPYAINNFFYHFWAASTFQELGDWENCAAEYRKVIAVLEKNEGGGDLVYDMKAGLGGPLYHLGKYDEARQLYGEYMNHCKELYGENSMKYANALKYYANIEGFCNDIESGEKHYVECMNILKKLVSKQLQFVTLEERNAFWENIEPVLRGMTGYALRAGNVQDEFTKNCYDALLFSKSLLLETDKTMTEAVNMKCNPEEKQAYYEWQALRQKLTDLSSNVEKNRDQITTVQNKIAALDRRVTTITSRLGYTDFLNKEYVDIKGALKDEEVLIDFTDFYSDRKVTQHIAYVVDNSQRYPLLLKYLTTEDVMACLDGFPIDRLHNAALKDKVLDLLWYPLSPYVGGKKTIYYVPSGILHQIALESIPMGDGTLLGEHYNFVRLTSAREIEKYKNNLDVSDKSNALLYGGLKYSLDNATMQIAAAKHDTPPLFAKRGSLRGDTIHYLPHSLEEVDKVSKILAGTGVDTIVYKGADGTEESFIALDGKAPQILHLSTHGFYYTPEKASEVAYLKGYDDAMALSGLILSGGNAAWLGKKLPEGVLGGVLTANTIARLDLKGIDLLFLAACQAGNGKITPEGIYGLQRAFKKAGVKTIVMSLWDVNDIVAKEFSVKFYEELTKNGWDKRKAFEKAKSHIRKMGDPFKEPYYWACFVMLD